MNMEHLIKNKQLLLYGLFLAFGLIVLKWIETSFIIFHYSLELYTGLIAFIFTILGIWIAWNIKRISKSETFSIAHKEAKPTSTSFTRAIPGISKRELEVLQLMANGLSNQEIADQLFVSLNTIKTHSSKLFEKMEVQRRTQAVEKGRRLNLIN